MERERVREIHAVIETWWCWWCWWWYITYFRIGQIVGCFPYKLARVHFYFVLDLAVLLHVGPNHITTSSSHRQGGLPSGRFRSIRYLLPTACIRLLSVNLATCQNQRNVCLVGWDCRIFRLQLCRGGRLPKRVSWIWHQTIWWWGSSNTGALKNAEYPFIAIAPRSTLTWRGSTWLGPKYGSNRTKLCT